MSNGVLFCGSNRPAVLWISYGAGVFYKTLHEVGAAVEAISTSIQQWAARVHETAVAVESLAVNVWAAVSDVGSAVESVGAVLGGLLEVMETVVLNSVVKIRSILRSLIG